MRKIYVLDVSLVLYKGLKVGRIENGFLKKWKWQKWFTCRVFPSTREQVFLSPISVSYKKVTCVNLALAPTYNLNLEVMSCILSTLQVVTRENDVTEKEAPSLALGSCEFHQRYL